MEPKKQNSEKRVPKGNIKFSLQLSDEQKIAKASVLIHPFSFLIGKAGSGKTLLAVQIALDCFFKRTVDKIIITRPTVSTEDNGFLPGTEKEKMAPWLIPIRSNMRKVYNKPDVLEKMEVNEDIELVSLAHFRGRTFENAICIIDEFQNLSKAQLAMVLGRLGKGSYMIFTGDQQQVDLRDRNYSAINELAKLKGSEYINIVHLLDNHRHEAIDDVLERLNGI